MKPNTLNSILLLGVAVFLAILIYFHYDSQVVTSFWDDIQSEHNSSVTVPSSLLVSTTLEKGISPANIIFFEAERMGTETLIFWDATDELSLVGYQVEKACGNEPFKRIGWVYSREISHEPVYEFSDRTPFFDKSCLYRLKMVDFDGTAYYSPVTSTSATKF